MNTEVILLNEPVDMPSGTRYEFALVEKASSQKNERPDGVPYVDPRLSFSDLLWFMDVNTWHRRAITLKARLIIGRGWHLEPVDPDLESDEQHAAITALLETPQRDRRPGEQKQTFGEIVHRFLIDWYATGNAFLEVVRAMDGTAAEVYHVRAERVRRDMKLDGGYYQLVNGAPQVRFRGWEGDGEGNELLHFMQYDPLDDYYGAPEWLPAMGAMLLDRTGVEYNTYLFKNGLMAHFAVIVEGGRLGEKQVAALKTFLQENATGIQNAGRGLVLQNEADGIRIRIEKLNIDVKDMQFEKGRAFSRDEIATAHGVPPRLLGIMTAGQLGGAGEIAGQIKVFLETVIAPDRYLVEQFLTDTILRTFAGDGELRWKVRFQEPDLTDIQADAEYYTKALNPMTGWLRRDEVRQMEGLPPEEEDAARVAKAASMVQELRQMLDL